MRVGIIGLGDIAKKAYLPIISRKSGIEIVLCTRNRQTLQQLAKEYRIKEYVDNLDDLLKLGIDAAFVHTATEAHVGIARKLLQDRVPLYLDKPVAYSYQKTKAIIDLAKSLKIRMMVGFNRRFAPMYRDLLRKGDADIILMQKNRVYIPDDIRRFVFDDFIHVVDTLCYLMPGRVKDVAVKGLVKEQKLHNVVLQLSGESCTAIGIMNRDNGITEERLEYMSSGNKSVIKDLDQLVLFKEGEEIHQSYSGWKPVLERRGFVHIIDDFIESTQSKKESLSNLDDYLLTHQICEEIVKQLAIIKDNTQK